MGNIFKLFMEFLKKQDKKTILNVVFFMGIFVSVFVMFFPKFYETAKKIDDNSTTQVEIRGKLDTVISNQADAEKKMSLLIVNLMDEQTQHIDENINKKFEYVLKHLNKDASKEAILDAIKEMKIESLDNYKKILSVINSTQSTSTNEMSGNTYNIGVRKVDEKK